MASLHFPIIRTKRLGLTRTFDLANPEERALYFQAKAGRQIREIKKFLARGNFIAFLVGKKNSGKGTYSKLLSEALKTDKLVHISVGDVVRDTHGSWNKFIKSAEGKKMKSYYRGFISWDEAERKFISKDQSSLIPTEFIIALLRARLEKFHNKSIFLDGFPRDQAQVAYTLFFKEMIGRGKDRDMFILIDIPESIINERIKYRVICPNCKVPGNHKLLITSSIGFDRKTGEFYLKCDNLDCGGARMVRKEGDDLGIEPIRERLKNDQLVLRSAYELFGIPKITLRNSIPTDQVEGNFDSYEITPAYSFKLGAKDEVEVTETPWIVEDDKGVPSYSLLPAPVAISLIEQLAEILR